MKTTNRLQYLPGMVNFIFLGLVLCFFLSCKDDPEVEPQPFVVGHIAYASNRDSHQRIYIMDGDGKNQRKVTDDAFLVTQDEEYYGPSLSLDGAKIAFVIFPKNGTFSMQSGIGTVNVDGSGKQLLGTGAPDLQYITMISTPSWDEKGNVFFAAGTPNALYYYEHDNNNVFRVNAEWCFAVSYGCDQSLSPAAVVNKGSYCVLIGSNSKILKVNYVTGDVETLTNYGKNMTPSFDDGFDRILSSNGTDIFTITFTIGEDVVKQLTKSTGSTKCTEPVWSPDWSKIAFTCNGDIYVMNSDGSNQTNLTNTPDIAEGSPSWGK
jgi:Tol biopolymer transport system component